MTSWAKENEEKTVYTKSKDEEKETSWDIQIQYFSKIKNKNKNRSNKSQITIPNIRNEKNHRFITCKSSEWVVDGWRKRDQRGKERKLRGADQGCFRSEKGRSEIREWDESEMEEIWVVAPLPAQIARLATPMPTHTSYLTGTSAHSHRSTGLTSSGSHRSTGSQGGVGKKSQERDISVESLR